MDGLVAVQTPLSARETVLENFRVAGRVRSIDVAWSALKAWKYLNHSGTPLELHAYLKRRVPEVHVYPQSGPSNTFSAQLFVGSDEDCAKRMKELGIERDADASLLKAASWSIKEIGITSQERKGRQILTVEQREMLINVGKNQVVLEHVTKIPAFLIA